MANRFRIFSFLVVVLFLSVLFAAWNLGGTSQQDVAILHQYEFSRYAKSIDVLTPPERLLDALSQMSRGVRRLISSQESSVEFLDAPSVIRQVLSDTPYFAQVYPSEGYFYFRTMTQEGEVGGNFRLNDTDEGYLGFGYYLMSDQSQRVSGYLYGGAKKREFQANVSRLSATLSLVTYQGETTLFRDVPLPTTLPKALPLLPDERFVSAVRDESGLLFYLLFDSNEKSFYYVLDPQYVRLLHSMDKGSQLLMDPRSDFVFLQDETSRSLFVGALRSKVYSNSYFDGPFDQVPVKLNLRDSVYEAYPYLKLGGIDPHGFVCIKRGSRVAITPYKKYSSPTDLVQMVRSCRDSAVDEGAFRQCVTFDSKQAYHLDSPLFFADGTLLRGEVKTCEYQGPKIQMTSLLAKPD
ncbi:MAG: hypothetical protein KDD55_03930 [Bdellovibrionales bacterium]|nr:hypothetical protein [Bdellovibrionales bacterium]